MQLTPKKLFLTDSSGAALSAFLLGVVLVRFENTFGMPREILYFLAITACFLAIYSLMSFLLIKENGKPYLKIIGYANLLYCGVTVGLIIYFNRVLTNWGLIYFLSEVAVIVTLAVVELKFASKQIDKKRD